MYDKEALLSGIDKIKANIVVLEDAIEAERARIKEYYRIIDELDAKERALASVTVEVVRDDGTN